MAIRLSLISVAAALSLFLASAAQGESLRIRYSVWVGYGPFFVAAEKGLFDKEGVEVELIQIEDDTATLADLFAGPDSGPMNLAGKEVPYPHLVAGGIRAPQRLAVLRQCAAQGGWPQ